MAKKVRKKPISWLTFLQQIFEHFTKSGIKDFFLLRVAMVTIITSVGGNVLTTVLDAAELNTKNYVGFAILLALITSLVVFFKMLGVLKTNAGKVFKAGLIGAALSFLLIFFFLRTYDELTFTFTEGFPDTVTKAVQGPSVNHLRGFYYSDNAKRTGDEYKKQLGVQAADSALLREFGGLQGYSLIWEDTSVQRSKDILFILYVLLVIIVSGTISLLTEAIYKFFRSRIAMQ